MQFVKPPPFILGPRPIMIFGMGSHNYPHSRNSVGYYMVDMLGRRLGSSFYKNRLCNGYLAHFPEENLLLVKPDTYMVYDNRECLKRVVDRFDEVTPMKSVMIYHETQLPLGEVEYRTKGRTDHNPDLHKIATELKSEWFPRIAVGIEYPSSSVRFEGTPLHDLYSPDEDTDQLFLLNKFPEDHWIKLHREVIPKVFAAVDAAIGDIRSTYPMTSAPVHPLRPDQYLSTKNDDIRILDGDIPQQITTMLDKNGPMTGVPPPPAYDTTSRPGPTDGVDSVGFRTFSDIPPTPRRRR
eukprot:TRINITY_DN2537_c0_g1_i1.p1 TRINITY_DN2537_c0_g1~~TRINITY_DN2537_c0_g1_i1.p1  ORF type:complete len:295 (-),score=79.32 TRINITY_DN2537_c0_g1_i1:36-920(-)